MKPLARSACAAVLLLLLFAPSVSAHAEADTSEPASGANLATAPTLVWVHFTEKVDTVGSRLQVLDGAGRHYETGKQTVSDDRFTLTTAVQALPAGVYSIEWRALSATDGHSTSGSISFGVNTDAAIPSQRASDVNALNLPSAVARALAFLGLSMAAGGIAFLAILRPAPNPAKAHLAIAMGAALHTLGILLLLWITFDANQGALRANLPAGWDRSDLLRAFLASKTAHTLALRLVLALGATWIGALALRSDGTRGPLLAAALLAGSALGSSELGHGSLGGPAVVTIDFVHLVATTLWIGALLLLVPMSRSVSHDPTALARFGRRFGTLALTCLLILAATGVILALDIVGTLRLSLLDATWGKALATKVVLMFAMAGVGGINRYVVLDDPATKGWQAHLQKITGKLTAGRIRPLSAGGEAPSFRALVRAEALFGVVVLVVVGILTSVSPPSAALVDQAPVTHFVAFGDAFNVTMDVAPAPVAGSMSTLKLTIIEKGGATLDSTTACGRPSCVQLNITLAGRSPEIVDAAWNTDHWEVPNHLWATAATATVTVRMSNAHIYEDYATVNVPVAAA